MKRWRCVEKDKKFVKYWLNLNMLLRRENSDDYDNKYLKIMMN